MSRPIRMIKDEYVQAYRGLPHRAWILFAVNLVNSSGSMVIFFLSLYLTRKLGLSTFRAGQMLSLPLVTALVAGRADDTNRGRYMGLSSLVFPWPSS